MYCERSVSLDCLTVVELKKKLMIEDMSYIIRSTVSSEFICHFPNFFDLRLHCERRDDFLNLVKLRFAHLKPSVTLKVYGVVSFSNPWQCITLCKCIASGKFKGLPHHPCQQKVRT